MDSVTEHLTGHLSKGEQYLPELLYHNEGESKKDVEVTGPPTITFSM